MEAAVIISRLKSLTATSTSLAFTDASAIAGWSKQGILAVVETTIMCGYPDGSFKPEAPIKRGEALVAINNSINYIFDNPKTEQKATAFESVGNIYAPYYR